MNWHEHGEGVWTRLMRAAREVSAANGRGQTPKVRFWIITMMLVLVWPVDAEDPMSAHGGSEALTSAPTWQVSS